MRGHVNDLNRIILEEILVKLFTSDPSEDEIVLRVLSLSLSSAPKDILSSCYQLMVDKKLFDLIIKYSKIFHDVHQEFIHPMLRHANELVSKGLNPCNPAANYSEQGSANLDSINTSVQNENTDFDSNKFYHQNKTAVDIVEVVISWRKRDLEVLHGILAQNFEKNENSMEDVNLAVNVLLQVACLVDANVHSLSKRSISLIYEVIENKIFPVCELQFGGWMNCLFKKIVEKPKEYESCEIFSLISFLFPYLEINSVGSFILQLQNNIVDLFECETKVVTSLTTFLSKLLAKYPPNLEIEELNILYDKISKECTNTYFLYNLKAMVLEAVGTYFPSCLNNIIPYFSLLVENLLYSDNTKSLSVALGFLNKIFTTISDSEKSTLFQKVFCLLNCKAFVKILSTEIMLKIIGIMDLSIDYVLQKQNELDQTFELTDIVTKLFEGITSLIQKKLSHDKDICGKFSTVLIKLRHSLDIKRLINVYAVFGTISCQDQVQFFRIVAEDLQYNAYSTLDFICDDFWKSNDLWFKIKLCINLISSVFESIHIEPFTLYGDDTDQGTDRENFPFSILVKLSNSDRNLANIVWYELFFCAWNNLTTDQEKLLRPKVGRFITVCIEQCDADKESSSFKDMFMKIAYKCNCELPPNINSELNCRSFDLQDQCLRVLGRSKNFSELSDMQQTVALQSLADVYSAIEEQDIQLPIDQFNSSFNNFTIGGTELLKRKEYLHAHETFCESLKMLTENSFIPIKGYEWEYCMKQMTRCVAELSNWKNMENMDINYELLSLIYPKSKCNALVNSSLKSFILKSKGNALEIEDFNSLRKEDIYEAIFQCITEWKSLPQVYLSPNHYTLLQLMQQLTELLEVYNLLDLKKVGSICSHDLFTMSKNIEVTARKWKFLPYALSDDFSFISELFNVRQKSLEMYAKKCHEVPLYRMANQTIKLSNDFANKLASIGVQFQRMTDQNVRCEEFTLANAYELLKVKFMSIITNTKKLISQNKLELNDRICVEKKLDDLINWNLPVINQFDKDRKGTIFLYCNKIQTILDSTSECVIENTEFDIPQIFEGCILLAEQYERQLQKSSNEKYAIKLMDCLVRACKYGTTLEIQKLAPRILHCLEYDGGNAELAIKLHESFFKCNISHKYWLPYLPYFVSILQNAIMVRSRTCKKIVTRFIKMLSFKFPQQVFFAIESMKNMQDVNEIEDKRKEVIFYIKKMHWELSSKLEAIKGTFVQFEKLNFDYEVQFSQEVLHIMYSIAHENRKNEKFSTDAVLEYLSNRFCKVLMKCLPRDCDFLINQFLREITMLNQLQNCPMEKIIVELERFVSGLSAVCKELWPRFCYLTKENPILSSQYLKNDVFLFDQIFCEKPSPVKISKFCSKVVCLVGNNTLKYKIDVLGNDGKTYSFILETDIGREESLQSLKLMRLLECLNPLLKSNHDCAKQRLEFKFTRYIFINGRWKLSAYEDDGILIRNNMPFRDYKISENSREDYFTKWIDKLYSHPLDFDNIRQQFLKELAVLCATEFLNICLMKELVIHKGSIRLSISHLAMNEEKTMSYCTLLSPVIRKYLLPVRIKVLAKHILHILTCLKENEENYFSMTAILHLMKKNRPADEKYQHSCNVVSNIVKNVLNVNLFAVNNHLQREI